jgi:hypothetical protein
VIKVINVLTTMFKVFSAYGINKDCINEYKSFISDIEYKDDKLVITLAKKIYDFKDKVTFFINNNKYCVIYDNNTIEQKVNEMNDFTKIMFRILVTCKKREEPWSHILNFINYNEEEYFIISADDIKKSRQSWNGKDNQFEPRILAYQQFASSRPTIFKKKNLNLLPIENGKYILTKKNIYKNILYDDNIPINLIEKNEKSVVLKIGKSETSLIDNLRYSGVFERPEILGEKILYGPLLNGRHRCHLSIKLDDKPIDIKGVQYEVDSCYETENKILIIEGKSYTNNIDSFNIRQLFFPFRELKNKVGNQKEIMCMFLHELDSIVNIWTFNFTDPDNMLSIIQTGYFRYKFKN